MKDAGSPNFCCPEISPNAHPHSKRRAMCSFCAFLQNNRKGIRHMPQPRSGRLPAEVDSLIRVDLDMVLDKLDINFDQFVDFCIICGTDYVEG